MQISTASWHYRFIDKFSDYRPPSNLCPYMRKLVLFILMFPAGAFGLGAILFVLTAPIWFMFTGWDAGLAFALLGGAINIILLSLFWQSYREDPHGNSAFHDDLLPGLVIQKPAFFALIGAWFQARHDEICPVLIFTNEEEFK